MYALDTRKGDYDYDSNSDSDFNGDSNYKGGFLCLNFFNFNLD